jgi:Fibronectin type III domain
MHNIAPPNSFVRLTGYLFFAFLVAASPMRLAVSAVTITISGTPAKSVVAGQAYAFKPTATAAAGKILQFSIANKPAWARFSASTGALAGTPAAASVGTYLGIVISASDGTTKVALPAFAITVTQIGVKSATLSWDAPTQNVDGSALTNLAGYRIFYGTSRNSLTQSITISSVGVLTYVISNLSSGSTYYFAIKAYNTAGVQSTLSTTVSKSM